MRDRTVTTPKPPGGEESISVEHRVRSKEGKEVRFVAHWTRGEDREFQNIEVLSPQPDDIQDDGQTRKASCRLPTKEGPDLVVSWEWKGTRLTKVILEDPR